MNYKPDNSKNIALPSQGNLPSGRQGWLGAAKTEGGIKTVYKEKQDSLALLVIL